MRISYTLVMPEDAATLVAFEQRVADPKLYSPPRDLPTALKDITDNSFYFIRTGDTVLGTISYRLRPDQIAYVSNLAVDQLYRRKGIARAALLFVFKKCAAATRMELVVHPGNKIALRLYNSLGFEMKSRQENYFGDGEPRLLLTCISFEALQ
jgi:ribosomal-protein-alanine N-acetyltransferase